MLCSKYININNQYKWQKYDMGYCSIKKQHKVFTTRIHTDQLARTAYNLYIYLHCFYYTNVSIQRHLISIFICIRVSDTIAPLTCTFDFTLTIQLSFVSYSVLYKHGLC